MELAQQNVLPHSVNVLFRVLVALLTTECGKGCKVLDIVQQYLGLSVVALVVRLCCVRATVQLKVQLAIPSTQIDRAVCLFLLDASEEVVDTVTHLHLRQKTNLVAEPTGTSQFLNVPKSRSSTAIALAKDEQTGRILVHGLVLSLTAFHIAKVGLCSVSLRRSHVADHLAAIQ
jgi:hypothetical protein